MQNVEMPTLEALDAIADKIRGGNLSSRSVESIVVDWRELLKHYKIMGIDRSQEQIWWRARVCETSEGYSDLNKMIYPPNGSSEHGRASLPEERILYGSWNPRTALREIGVQKGCYVQLIGYRVIPGVQFPCFVVGEAENFTNCGRSVLSEMLTVAFNDMALESPIEFENFLYIDSVCAEIFRRDVKRSFEYKTSATLAHVLLGQKKGLIYPSVEAQNAMNLVVRAEEFNDCFEVIYTSLSKVEESFGHGIYRMSIANESFSFEDDGYIKWGEGRAPESTFSLQEGRVITESFKGWRVPRKSR
jgi:hypothetical protein